MGSTPVCPRCGYGQVARWGKVSGLQRYRCGACHATFNVPIGTPLARLRCKDKRLTYAQQMTEGQCGRKSAATCGAHRNTAIRWCHPFLDLPNVLRAMLLSDEQVPVPICQDRADKGCIGAALKPILAADAILCTDGGRALGAVARAMGITHRLVKWAQGIRMIAVVYHDQYVNAYDSRLKAWMHRFHGVATRYLENYLGWCRLIGRAHNVPQPRTVLLAALGVNHDQPFTVTWPEGRL